MGRVIGCDIKFCDMCGKKVSRCVGRMVVSKYPEKGGYSQRALKSWGLCKKCMTKLAGMQSLGDKIKEEIETKLAKIQIENTPLELLK
ncbi:MAG: hypothetical protein U9R08_03615 [Nanoarchaeota archaeon]|nr:hypothetical protein [Nanoarchaeota archaeon]